MDSSLDVWEPDKMLGGGGEARVCSLIASGQLECAGNCCFLNKNLTQFFIVQKDWTEL